MAKMSTRGPTKRFLISEMDRSVKRMLKLIEEDGGDSFAKKAEIYLQKRPELISQVEDFYRMFRSLAERYDDATNELRRLREMNEIYSAPQSAVTSPEHHRFSRRLSSGAAAFLEAIGNKGYENSIYDSSSDIDHDDPLHYNNNRASSDYSNYRRLRGKITELESELKKLQVEHEGNISNNNDGVDYKEELRIAKEKIQSSEEEISELKAKLEKYEVLQYEAEAEEDDMEDESDVEDELEQLKSEREELVMRLSEIEEETRLKDDQIEELNGRLQKVQWECERGSKTIEELREVIEKQRVMIEEGTEERVQAERQLSISLEHYRNAYQMLRKGILEQKKSVVTS